MHSRELRAGIHGYCMRNFDKVITAGAHLDPHIWILVIVTVVIASFVPCMAASIILNVKEWWRKRSLRHDCPEKCVKLVLSDLDGSIVFTYVKGSMAEKSLNARVLRGKSSLSPKPKVLSLPVSQTGRRGFITMNILQLCGSIREKGVPFVLISGTRYSTFSSRLPYLPFADAYVIENGGRIFYPKPNSCRTLCKGNQIYPVGPLEEDLEEDMAWRSRLSDGGGDGASQDFLTPGERVGPLWDVYRHLVSAGCRVDTHQYYTMIRVSPGDGAHSLEQIIQTLPPTLSCTRNYDTVDFFPRQSGKRQATLYLVNNRFRINIENAVTLCDGDNDIEMAESVSHAYIPLFASNSMRDAAAARPDHYTVAYRKGTAASEEMLKLIALQCHPGQPL